MLKIFKHKVLDLTGRKFITRYVTKYNKSYLPVSISMEYDDDAKAIQRILDVIVRKNLFKQALPECDINEHYYLVWALTDKEVKDLIVPEKLKNLLYNNESHD